MTKKQTNNWWEKLLKIEKALEKAILSPDSAPLFLEKMYKIKSELEENSNDTACRTGDEFVKIWKLDKQERSHIYLDAYFENQKEIVKLCTII